MHERGAPNVPRTRWTEDEIRHALAPDLEVVRRIGEGAMAVVYLAREPALRRLVAVKVLRPELFVDPVVRQRFEREAQSAARISHPHVAAVHRIGTLPDAVPYMVMEYIEGRTLKEVLLAAGPLSLEETTRTLGDVAAALAAAHRKGIVHRDIRPANVMREHETGRTVLMDFGIAALLDSGAEVAARLTAVGQLLGDPRYLSPEQLRGEPVIEQSDIYALGLLGYELLTGSSPFEGRTAQATLRAQLQAPPPRLQSLRPDAPPRLIATLERCLAKHPAHRPRAADLSSALLGTESSASPVDAPGAGDSGNVMPGFASFLKELRRRHVYRVAVTYLAAAFVTLQAGDLVLPALPLPEWSYEALVAAVLAGFPLALALSWLFDITTAGVRRTSPAPGDRRSQHSVRRALPWISLAATGAAALAAWFWWRGRGG